MNTWRIQTITTANQAKFRILVVLNMVAIMVFVIYPSAYARRTYAASQANTPIMRPQFPVTAPYGSFFSSPALVDLDLDGRKDIVTADSTGCIWAYRDNGLLLPNFPIKTGGVCDNAPRIRGPVAVGDLDKDGRVELVVGTRGTSTLSSYGKVMAFRADGSVYPGFPLDLDWQSVDTANIPEVQAVSLADVDGDTYLDIIAVTSNEDGYETTSGKNVFVWNRFGQRLAGFPVGGKRGGGIFGQLATGDVDGDGKADLLIGRDEMYISLYGSDGNQKPGWPQSTYLDLTKKTWGTDKYIEFTQSAGAIADIDNDGRTDIVLAGKVRDPLAGSQHPTIGDTLLVYNSDGTRKNGWLLPPLSGALLNTSVQANHPVSVADVDGDGKFEIFVSYNDGTVRAFRANGTSLWVKNITNNTVILPSEVIIADVTGDTKPEVLFTTFSSDGTATSLTGVFAVDAMTGATVPGYPLSFPNEASTRGGSMAAPSVDDLDHDGLLEIVVHSYGGTLYVWNTAQPNTMVLWSTSRGDIRRSGTGVRVPTTMPTATSVPTTMPTATSVPTTMPTATPNTVSNAITRLVLVNADTDRDIRVLATSDTIDMAQIGTKNINIRAETNPPIVGSVKFMWDTTTVVENYAVYALAGNTGSDYKAWTPSNGRHTLKVTAFGLSNAQGASGQTLTFSLTVVNSHGGSSLSLQGDTGIFLPLVMTHNAPMTGNKQ